MPAFHNHSMLEDDRRDPVEKIKKEFRLKKYLDGAYSTVGHTYAVIVEVCDIRNPDIREFIEELNKRIEVGGCGYARISSPLDYLYSLTLHRLAWLLDDMKIGEKEQEKILEAAYPPTRLMY
ncbi:MAG: hypothetical protein GXP44_02760 [bacterium]|nr:hypothetical protein [bacterium]